MDWKEVIENLKYLISEDCTDTQFDYADEIEIAIRVMESQEDLRSKINKAIEEMNQLADHKIKPISFDQSVAIDMCIDILKRNIGERKRNDMDNINDCNSSSNFVGNN